MSTLDAYRFTVEGSSSDPFIYPLGPRGVPGPVRGTRDEAIIQTWFLPT